MNKCLRSDGRRVEGPVTKVFAGSTPVPRTNLPVKYKYLWGAIILIR